MGAAKDFLTYLGGRRPASLADQAQYQETVSRPKAEPKAHRNPKGVQGESMGRGTGRTSGKGRKS